MSFLQKLSFGSGVRIRFYNNMSLLLENQVQLIDALKQIIVIMEKNKKSNSAEAKVAVACYEALSQGESFSAGLEEWVPSSEIALIAAGEVSGELERCLKDAVKLIEGVMQIRKAVIGATIYPTVLIIMLSCLLHIIADSLVPKLAAVTSPETWEGAAYILYIIAEITTNYGIYILVGVVGSIVAILFSFRFLNGNIRVFLDKIPPWSVYRAVHGCIFLLNLSLLLRAGVRLQAALELLYVKAGTKWLLCRIDAILQGISSGFSLGEAMSNSPYVFPDEESVCYVQLLCVLQGFEESLICFSAHWLEKTVATVKAAAAMFLLTSVLTMGCTLGLVVLGVSGIESAIQQSVQ
ncbi:hypothetical protein FPD60_20750 [Salmonella enterica subsp. enterica]|nr:type II secretion system F family protein [Salmonella enterica]ECH0882660.1 hypothetical protein [Salmonella enterica subsp. enterica serovar Potsdam]EDT6676217.1 hypothetical protein [Salmonella enterica subsp. enterica]ECZ9690145.1 hypothetical protein [Salmonella enterica subsp. enterica serovar Potsdam]EIU8190945.1 type II secretion system F family protein [Salmonella enterica subsp. enterica serovar Potsdam]HDH3856142.1 type II secretion system F family protein [Salmonella enterica sub